jgi:ATP-binding cassette subfamily B protein
MLRATDDVKVDARAGSLLALSRGAGGHAGHHLARQLSVTLAILPILPLALILFMVFSAVVQPLFMAVQIRLSKLNTILQENLAGIKVVKAFAREPSEQQKFVKSADELMTQQLKVMRLMTFLFPLIFLIANIGQAIVLYAGGTQIINGTMTLGQYQEFSLYLMFVFMPIGQLGFIITQMAQASASAGRVFEIMDAKSDVTDKPNAIALPEIRGAVEFKDVLLVNTGEQTHVGQPLVSGATVTGTVEGEGLGDKVLVFKYKAKKQYRRTRGHRQAYSKVHIDKISMAGTTA